MAQADWTIVGTGSFSVIVDGTSPGTNTSVIDIADNLILGNSTVGAIQNCRIEAFIKAQTYLGGTFGCFLRNSSVVSNPTTGAQFRINNTGSNFAVDITTWVTGVSNTITSTTLAPLTGLNTDWQKWRFSIFTSGGVSYARSELWNGAAYVTLLDGVSGAASLAGASGTACFYVTAGPSVNHIRFDDVKIYTLA